MSRHSKKFAASIGCNVHVAADELTSTRQYAKIFFEVINLTVYTFWEPREKIPYYIRLCMKTWEKFLPNTEIILLDYKNIREYVDIDELGEVLLSGRFSLRQVSDALRVALLAKHGGVWMDTDTIVLSSDIEKYFLPDEKNRTIFFGNSKTRSPHIAFINTPPAAKCMNLWLEFIKERLQTLTPETEIGSLFLSNTFINSYSKNHADEIEILDRKLVMPELKIIPKSEGLSQQSRMNAHQTYYNVQNRHLADVDVDMVMLHNSWVPGLYRKFSPEDLLRCDCTLTNILAEALDMPLPPEKDRFRLEGAGTKWSTVPNTPPPPPPKRRFRLVSLEDKLNNSPPKN